MEPSTVIANLPPLTQFAVNLAVFVVTLIIAIRSYTNKKMHVEDVDEDIDGSIEKNKRKLIVILKGIDDSLVRMANSIQKIEENITKETQTAEIEREIQRRVEQKLKRGSKNFVDTGDG